MFDPEERKKEVRLILFLVFYDCFFACIVYQSIDLLEFTLLDETPNLLLYLLSFCEAG